MYKRQELTGFAFRVKSCAVNSAVKLISGFSVTPLLVVTRITPFAPLVPKIAVDEASFKIVIDSTSVGSINVRSLSTPSTKIIGA